MFAGTNADRILHGNHEDLPVSDLARLAGLLQRERDLLDLIIGYDDLELQLGQEVNDILRSAVELCGMD